MVERGRSVIEGTNAHVGRSANREAYLPCLLTGGAPSKATGTPHFSPHGLRKRRGSLLSKQGYSLAEIAERLGDTKVVTAEHYLFALGDYAEVDYQAELDR